MLLCPSCSHVIKARFDVCGRIQRITDVHESSVLFLRVDGQKNTFDLHKHIELATVGELIYAPNILHACTVLTKSLESLNVGIFSENHDGRW